MCGYYVVPNLINIILTYTCKQVSNDITGIIVVQEFLHRAQIRL